MSAPDERETTAPGAPLELTQPPQPTAEGDAGQRAIRGMFGGDSLYMAVWALQLGAAAVLTPVFTRLLDSEQFGGLAAATAVMQVLCVVAGLGLQTAIQRHYAAKGGPVDAARLLTLSIVVSLGVTAAAYVTAPWWSGYLGFGTYGDAVQLAVLWAGASAVTSSALGLLRSKDRLLAFSCVSLLQSVAAEAASLVFVLTVHPTASAFLLGQLLAQCAAVLLALLLTPPKMLRWQDRGLSRAALVFAVPLVPAVLSEFVLAAADRLMLQSELGQTAVARYQIAYNIGSMPMLLLGILNSVWMPRIFAVDRAEDLAAVLAASRDALYRVLTPVVVGLALGAPLVLRLWAPPAYRPDELLVVNAIVLVGVIPFTGGLAATRALLSAGKTGSIAVASATAAVANVLLNLILIPRLGLAGAAVATLSAYTLLYGLLQLRARVVAPTGRTPRQRMLWLAAAAVVAILASVAPVSIGFLAARATLATGALIWFAWTVRRVSARSPASPAVSGAGGRGRS